MERDLDTLTEQLQRRLFVELEASGRHVHVTKEQAIRLFGHDLTPARDLSQPGQYLAQERVSVIGPKGKFDGVAVLGPCRPEGQVEISLTDARSLGLQPPVRLSGDVQQSSGATLVGPCGSVNLEQGVIIAQAAVNMIRKMKKTPLSVAILVVAAALMLAVDLFALNFSTIWMILIAAVIGIAVKNLEKRGEKK